jgi:hypothetical protein
MTLQPMASGARWPVRREHTVQAGVAEAAVAVVRVRRHDRARRARQPGLITQ